MDVVIDILYLSRLSGRSSGCCRDTKEENTSELDKDFVEHCRLRKTCGVSSELNRSELIRFNLKGSEERPKGKSAAWHGMMVVF